MKKYFILLLLMALPILKSWAIEDDHHIHSGKCGTIAPGLEWENKFQSFLLNPNLANARIAASIDTPYAIPVIVHIIHNGTITQNISTTKVNAQIAALNRGFNAADQQIGNVPSYFQNLIGNPRINFCLAVQDPNGNIMTTPGIERIRASDRGWDANAGFDRNFIENTIKQNTIWNPNYYLNIWVLNLVQETGNGEVIAYAAFPPLSGLDGMPVGNINTLNDGVACNYQYFGQGPLMSDYTLGKSMIHEVGHWLGLRHIWGDDESIYDPVGDSIIKLLDNDPRACEESDYVDDTPNAAIPNFRCYTAPRITCSNGPNGEMYMNYMDYSTDVCLNMFTKGQTERMWTAIQNSPLRANVVKSKTCTTTPIAPFANFLESTRGVCQGQSIVFTDKSSFKPTSWLWEFEGGTPATSTLQNPTVTYNVPPGTYNVKLTVTNSAGSNNIQKLDHITVVPVVNLPISENFEGSAYPPSGWSLVTRNSININWDTIATAGLPNPETNNTSIYWNNTEMDATGFKDDIRTPKLNFNSTVDPKLTFQVGYAPYSSGVPADDAAYQDSLEVLISLNCGSTFTSIYKKGGDQLKTQPGQGPDWVPDTTTHWRKETLNLASFNGNGEVMVVFRNIARFGHSIYLDDINISDISTVAPVASFNTSATTICTTESITFTNTSTGSPTSISWNFGGGGTPNTSTANSPVVQFNSAGTYTVTLTATNTIGSNSTSKTIIVNAKPNVTVNNASICSGQSVTLTAGGANSYVWTPGGASTSSISITPTLTTNYTVVGTATNGCKDTATSAVTVNASPIANSGNDKVISCITPSVQLGTAGVAGNTYTWTPTAGLSSSTVAQPNATIAANYRVVVTTTATGCSDTDFVEVTSNVTTPNANAGADKAITCTASTVQLNGSSTTSGVSYSWSGPGIVSGGTTATPTVNAAGTYTVTVTNPANGCTSTDVAIVSNNSALPNANAGLDKTITCTAPSVQLNGSSTSSGVSYSWSGPGIVSGGATATATVNAAGTYTLTVTNPSNSCTSTDVVIVTANNTLPVVSASNAVICTGQQGTLTANGANSYSWTGPGIVSGGTTATVTVNAAGTYTVTGTNTSNGCAATATGIVTINNAVPTITVNSPTICTGESVTLTASGASSYTWNTGASGASITVSPNITTVYTVVGSTSCNSGNGSSTVTVNTKPTVSVTDATGCTGSSQTLNASGASSYTWSNGGSGASINVTVGNANSTIEVIGTSTGCKDTATANITVLPSPATPSITRADSVLTCTVVGTSYKWYKDGVLIPSATSQSYKMSSNGVYKVEVYNSDNCKSEATLSVISLPVKSNSISGIQIIPNPNKGVFAVQLQSGKNTTLIVELYATNGQQVMNTIWEVKAGQNTFNVVDERLADGMYFLNMNNEEGTSSMRIVVQR